MYHLTPYKVVEAEVFPWLPDHLRRDKGADLLARIPENVSTWSADAALAGRHYEIRHQRGSAVAPVISGARRRHYADRRAADLEGLHDLRGKVAIQGVFSPARRQQLRKRPDEVAGEARLELAIAVLETGALAAKLHSRGSGTDCWS
jgi:hypothetical protein